VSGVHAIYSRHGGLGRRENLLLWPAATVLARYKMACPSQRQQLNQNISGGVKFAGARRDEVTRVNEAKYRRSGLKLIFEKANQCPRAAKSASAHRRNQRLAPKRPIIIG